MDELMILLARWFPVVNYGEYLKSSRWKKKARAARKRAGQRCQLCYADDVPLEVHHRTYMRLGWEVPGDLVALCGECHSRHHGRG